MRQCRRCSSTSTSRPTRARQNASSATSTPPTNPRFIVTSLGTGKIVGQELYERIYCARGEMENRIKECQLDLYADHTSAATMHANQIRLWFASLAYVLMEAVRRLALAGTELAHATAGTIRSSCSRSGPWSR